MFKFNVQFQNRMSYEEFQTYSKKTSDQKAS